ncbi:hypothetical protein GGX14DRAFT_671435 [Mycena pura]|uniref:Uncharacterized protein n=1 Tax=Mycena pura TaxID=153505 RepID=A0AAD6Y374_9AGAR|nr:hypothetical protein GGX14DRAFT_671435 [Mycena pura]
MTSFLKSTTDSVRSAAQQGAHGVQSAGNFVGDTAQQGVQGVGKGVSSVFDGASGAGAGAGAKSENDAQPNQQASDAGPDEAPQSQSQPGLVGGISGGFQTAGSALSSGLQGGAGFVGDVTKTGLSIGEKVARTGADMTGNVLVSTVGLAGTAIGGVVNAAAETSGKVFEPVAAGLRSIEGLEGLADSLEKINGLPVAAVKQVGAWTIQAINMAGKTPTFFDRDGDGVVHVQDTINGLIVLGLAEKSATYAAYALHGVFSYSTSDSWIPSKDTALPIHIDKMNDTRWGRNWGNFDRIEWCSDMDVETFFETAGEEASTLEKWQKTITKGRQGFGVLLLIFEWGTTWPWLMPDLPVADIPFKDDIGRVVRTVILPTIFKNWQIAHGITPNKDSEPVAKKDEE